MEQFRREENLHKNWLSQEIPQAETTTVTSPTEDKHLSWPFCVLAKQILTERNLPYQDMNIESNRLATFQAERWSNFDLSFIYRLANAGFFSTGTDDVVRCFSCSVQIGDWQPEKSPKQRHRQSNPKCRFVNGIDRRNITDIHYVLDTPESDVSQRSSNPNRGADATSNGTSHVTEETQRRTQEKAGAERFRSEMNRLLTFKEWPFSIPVDPYELANSGFFVMPGTTTVQCFACLGRIPAPRWRVGDRPRDTHRRMFPSCPFVLGKHTGNRILREGERAEALRHDIHQKAAAHRPKTAIRPKYPQFRSRELRIATFANWRNNARVTPRDLADAGFFYSNKDDRVTCFCCGCRLQEWVVGDDPWEEHRKWSPHCTWLNEQKHR